MRLARVGQGALAAGALAVPAPRPATRPTLSFLQLLLGPANAALARCLLLCVLDPAYELVAGQGRDVLPRTEGGGVGDERLAKVTGKLVDHPAGHCPAAHRTKVTVEHAGAAQELARQRRRLVGAWLDRGVLAADRATVGVALVSAASRPGRLAR